LTGRISVAVRVAGIVVAAGYLLGVTEGPVMMSIGALALITFGRGLVVDRSHEALAGGALAVIAGAIGVVALRWGTFDLGEIRGAQGVLGPSLSIGPQETAIAVGVAAGAGLVALIVWLGEAPVTDAGLRWLWPAEALCGALALVTAFWGPALRGLEPIDLLTWSVTVGTTTVVGVLGGRLVRRVPRSVVWSAWAVSSGATVTAAIVVAVG
jgi:hypothetical protein